MSAAVLLGCLEGLLVALLAVGVVLIYKAERFVNFANAQLGVLSSLLLAKLVLDAGVSWYLAFLAAVLLGVVVGAGCRLLVVSRMENASRTSLMIATLGLSQLLLALAYFEWLGPDRSRLRDEGYPLPFAVLWNFDGLAVTARHVLIAVVAPTIMLLLVVWLRTSSFGRTMRAAASNPDAARLAGIDVRRTSAAAWAIAGGLSAIGAVLVSPGQAVLEVQSTGPMLLFLALGAAGLAGFTSLSGAVAAGIALGIVEGVAVHVGHSTGAGVAAVFATVVVGLLVRSVLVGGAAADDVRIERSEERLRIPEAIAGRWWMRRRTLALAGIAVSIGILLPFLPWLREPHRTFVLANVLVFALATLSLTMLSGWGGHVSLGHFTLVAIGAFTAVRLAPRGWSLLATMLVAGVVGAVFAVLVGLPAARSRGLTFAVTSLGLAVVGPTWLFHQSWLAPPGTSSVEPAYQIWLGRLRTQRSVYLVALAVLTLVALALARLGRSNAGHAVMAVRDNGKAAATLGFSPERVRLTTFAMSGALAGAAGVLWLAVNRNVSGQVVRPTMSLLLLAAAVIGGVGSIAGAILGSFFVFGLPVLLAGPLYTVFPSTEQVQLFLAGAGLLQTQIVYPGGLASVLRGAVQRMIDRTTVPATPLTPAVAPRERSPREATTSPNTGSVALSLSEVRVAFGGVTAVGDVALHVGAGEIVGVIGANGAGKTTLLDAVCGLVPASGTIFVYGHDVGSLATAQRARLGLSRGFQDARLFPGLTVREMLQLALARRHPASTFGAIVGAPWVRLSERASAAEADRIIDRFGLGAYADVPGDRLSTGTRRLCGLAVQVATRPRLMILDEPTAGIAQRETEVLRALLRDVADDLGCAMLVVEHDMPFLMAVSDRIYCLDGGRVIAEGTPAAVREDPAVVASYLGVARRSAGAMSRRRARRPAPERSL